MLLDRYELKDIAIKVVGVGSVGTFCAVMLLMASEQDPLFLQVKEARPSVLEAYAGKSIYPNHGQRVVNGYRLMQSASDIFLGWTKGKLGRHFYVRQLKDMKLAPLVELFSPGMMVQYAEICGWALARAHARSGEPAQISGYLGKSDAFDKAIATFCHRLRRSERARPRKSSRRRCARDGWKSSWNRTSGWGIVSPDVEREGHRQNVPSSIQRCAVTSTTRRRRDYSPAVRPASCPTSARTRV